MSFEQHVCGGCAIDPYVVKIIKTDGILATCSFCKKRRKTIDLSDLADMVHEVFVKYAHQADDIPHVKHDSDNAWYEQGGKTPSDIIQEEILECELELADALVAHLADKYARDVIRGAADYYNQTSQEWELEVPYSPVHAEQWATFVESVKHRSRFFNRDQQAYLKRLLTPLLRGDLHHGTPPIVEIGNEHSSIRHIFRAREASNLSLRRVIYENLTCELGPPPPTLRTQGRMNAAGVAAFYGCTDVNTCVAEIRAAVGATAVVGEFEFLRPVRVLDLRLLNRSAVVGLSWFDPEFAEKAAYGRFIRGLHNIIRAPVLPGAESLDYLPTQMLAEYLAREADPPIEGVIFVSSLTSEPDHGAHSDGARTTGINIVLFESASSIVKDTDASSRRVVRIQEPLLGSDFPWESETVELKETSSATTATFGEDQATPASVVEPTLKLMKDRIKVVRVEAIHYSVNARDVIFESGGDQISISDLPF